MPNETIAVASDHAGVGLKAAIRRELEEMGYQVIDLGTHDAASVDYPDYGHAMAQCIEQGQASRGVLVCGTGIGISIAANRHQAVRAAVCQDVTTARLARRHNDANVLALGERIVGAAVASDCVRAFLETEFEGGRHAHRVAKL